MCRRYYFSSCFQPLAGSRLRVFLGSLWVPYSACSAFLHLISAPVKFLSLAVKASNAREHLQAQACQSFSQVLSAKKKKYTPLHPSPILSDCFWWPWLDFPPTLEDLNLFSPLPTVIASENVFFFGGQFFGSFSEKENKYHWDGKSQVEKRKWERPEARGDWQDDFISFFFQAV